MRLIWTTQPVCLGPGFQRSMQNRSPYGVAKVTNCLTETPCVVHLGEAVSLSGPLNQVSLCLYVMMQCTSGCGTKVVWSDYQKQHSAAFVHSEAAVHACTTGPKQHNKVCCHEFCYRVCSLACAGTIPRNAVSRYYKVALLNLHWLPEGSCQVSCGQFWRGCIWHGVLCLGSSSLQ